MTIENIADTAARHSSLGYEYMAEDLALLQAGQAYDPKHKRKVTRGISVVTEDFAAPGTVTDIYREGMYWKYETTFRDEEGEAYT